MEVRRTSSVAEPRVDTRHFFGSPSSPCVVEEHSRSTEHHHDHDASVQGATVSRCAEMRKLSYVQCIDRGLNWPLEIWARIDRFLDVTRALKAGVWRWQWRLGHGDRASLCFCGVSMPVQARRYIDAHIHPITLQFLLCLEQLFTKCFVRKHHAQLHAVRNSFGRSSNSHKPPLDNRSWLTPSKPKTNMFHALAWLADPRQAASNLLCPINCPIGRLRCYSDMCLSRARPSRRWCNGCRASHEARMTVFSGRIHAVLA
jgi:hypothetical protein